MNATVTLGVIGKDDSVVMIPVVDVFGHGLLTYSDFDANAQKFVVRVMIVADNGKVLNGNVRTFFGDKAPTISGRYAREVRGHFLSLKNMADAVKLADKTFVENSKVLSEITPTETLAAKF